jgi:hypothetical protein
VTDEIKAAAAALPAGSFFLLTFAGHGALMKNDDPHEHERFDQTWVLFDRQLIDDELSVLWPRFKPKVRILVIVDACHSGTPLTVLDGADVQRRTRSLPPEVAAATYRKHKNEYDDIRHSIVIPETNSIQASVLSISACEDTELAADGKPHGLFTGTLKTLWRYGKFKGSHENLWERISSRLAHKPQHPAWQYAGTLDPQFWHQPAFTL